MAEHDLGRPDPDALLAEAAKAGRGRLKVYLGMAPGVGKTSEMLTAARRRKAEGLDVVAGIIETHGRPETAALLEGLEVLPRKVIDHRGRPLKEFDLDAALARRPELLLVDEHAHSNVPGSRHPKRWQDVEELLAAGIDVWTTLNVQHLESLVDVVQRITGIVQRETVPDSVLSAADEIELIDITPKELRERLAQGKVYVPETATLAAERFFKPENLTALRELALRRAAETVDDQLVGVMRRQGITGPWAAGERILVLIGADAAAVAAAARSFDPRVLVVHAPDYAEGMGASLRTGVASLPGDADGAFVFLGDMPRVPTIVLRRMAEAVVGGAQAAAPIFKGRRGNPVLLGRALFPELLALTGDAGARGVLQALGDRLALIDSPDDGVLFDVDRISDLTASVGKTGK